MQSYGMRSLSRSRRALSSWDGPKANIYSFESMTNRNFFLPDSLSCFSQRFYNFVFAHFKNMGGIFSYYVSQSIKMLFRLFGFALCHNLSPHYNHYNNNTNNTLRQARPWLLFACSYSIYGGELDECTVKMRLQK